LGAKEHQLRRAAGAISVLAAVAISFGLMQASAVSARVQHDPCGSTHHKHVTSNGLHCSRVVEIPPHRTFVYELETGAPPCDRERGIIAPAFHSSYPRGPDWDYWTRNGEWVHWLLFVLTQTPGRYGQETDVLPGFHNFGPHPWPVRVFFRCASYEPPVR
jgi:hypothetical protein